MLVNDIKVLIVDRPSRIRDSLRALLKTVPTITVIEQVNDGRAALHKVTEMHPHILLLGAHLSDDEVSDALAHTKSVSPKTWCVALVDTIHQQDIANLAGADSVLFAGTTTGTLLTTIDQFISPEAR